MDASALILAHQFDKLLILNLLSTLDIQLAQSWIVCGEALSYVMHLLVGQVRLSAGELLEDVLALHHIEANHCALKCFLLSKHTLKVEPLQLRCFLADKLTEVTCDVVC